MSSNSLQRESGDLGANRPKEAALQDLATAQESLLVGLISRLTGEALQENVAAVVRHLIEQGRRILERHPNGFGLFGAATNSC